MRPSQVFWKESEPGIALLEMKGASGTNALDEYLVSDIERCLSEIGANSTLKVVILRGEPGYFSSGASVELLRDFVAGAKLPTEILLPRKVLACPIPVIACMEGHALGGGLALALACDFTFLSKKGRYGFTFMNFGFTPGMGSTGLSDEYFGPSLAAELLFTGKTVRGADLESAPGVTRVLNPSEVFPATLDLAREIAEKNGNSVRLLKEALSAPRREIYERAFKEEQRMHEITFKDPATRKLIQEWLDSEEKNNGP